MNDFLALLHGDRVHDGLALDALQAGLDDVELGGIHHHRHAGDIGLGGDEIEELHHGLLGIEQALVHVDVDDLRAVRHLIARHVESGGIIAVGDELAELGGARDVRALAHIHEGNVGGEREGLETRQAHERLQSSAPNAAPFRRPPRRWRGYAPAWCRSSRRPRSRSPASANSASIDAVASGRSSYRPNSLGRPAFG